MSSRIDLHTHTTASDGTMDPAVLVAKANELGVQVLAISDHDTTAGYQAAAAYLRTTSSVPIRLLPAIETNAEGDYACHLLGYRIDPQNLIFQHRLAELRRHRIERLRAMARRLENLGYPIDFAAVVARANGAALGRPHLADALIERGVVRSRQEAFNRFLNGQGPAYVPADSPTFEEAINLIGDAGGFAVLAHPSYYTSEALLRSLVERGLRGIEVFYPEHTRSLIESYLRWAKTYSLIVTGGSDFHGPKTGRSSLACVDVPTSVVEAIDSFDRIR